MPNWIYPVLQEVEELLIPKTGGCLFKIHNRIYTFKDIVILFECIGNLLYEMHCKTSSKRHDKIKITYKYFMYIYSICVTNCHNPGIN